MHTQQNVQPAAPEASQDPAEAAGGADDKKPGDGAPSVRFSSAIEEIAPTRSPLSPDAARGSDGVQDAPELSSQQLKEFSQSLQGRQLQEHRMAAFQFEAFSLPPSRVPSGEDSPNVSRVPTPNSPAYQRSPHGSPKISAMASPPLTPSGSDPTGSTEKMTTKLSGGRSSNPNDPQAITPQASTSHERAPQYDHRQPLAHRPASSDHALQRPSSLEERQGDPRAHRRGMLAQGGASMPVSRESSPSRSAASNYYSKPITPGGDVNDPYARGRRPAQQKHSSRYNIDPRFVFSRKAKKHGSPSSSKTSLTEKRGSGIFGRDSSHEMGPGEGAAGIGHHQPHGSGGSMSDLKRFFKGRSQSKKRDDSPASRSGTKTPPTSRSTNQVPFGEDHGLTTKYGKIGRVLGSGAGGAVRLMKRRGDGTVFAVKEFRPRHSYETEREYNKKVTAEFCVGSTLHHGNVIETMDIVREKGSWYEVMEYAPFDLFATVMTGKMTREEIRCCFLQILNGVTYLHSMGLAHRDLKLDNVVISDRGIMKIIDFGSAHVFRYPFETDIVMAKGIVGSDPYLAPEVYKEKEYDAAATDIWSLAIVFCCMTLRRFPWKLPQMTDNSWKLFAAEPTPGHDPAKLVHPSKRPGENHSHGTGRDDGSSKDSQHGQRHHKRGESTATVAAEEASSKPQDQQQISGEKKEVIRGPWRILRLLPRESRYIIWRMLDINAKTRATMSEILAEPWVADSQMCQQLDGGQIVPAEDHSHVLQPPNPAS